MQNTTNVLTVIVVDAQSKPTSGATVSLSPSGVSGVTDSTGQVDLKLGTSKKYDVTVVSNGNTVTVPYYVTSGGAARLLVNPTYVKAVEAARAGQGEGLNLSARSIGEGVGILLIVLVVWVLFRRYKNGARSRARARKQKGQ